MDNIGFYKNVPTFGCIDPDQTHVCSNNWNKLANGFLVQLPHCKATTSRSDPYISSEFWRQGAVWNLEFAILTGPYIIRAPGQWRKA
jgi:hypothetical protein